MKQLKVLQDRVKSVEEQRDKTQHELMNIESSGNQEFYSLQILSHLFLCLLIDFCFLSE